MKIKIPSTMKTFFGLIIVSAFVLTACQPAVAPTSAVVAPTTAAAAPTTAAAAPATVAPAQPKTYKILAVEKTLINQYWQTMKDGYDFAAKQYGQSIDVVTVPTEADTAGQLAAVETALTKGYDAVCVSPLTPDNLNPALADATKKGTPLINVDELIPDQVAKDAGITFATKIASNNYYAGVLAGQYMLSKLPAGSEVAVVEGLAGNSSGQARHDGFVATVKAGGFKVDASQPADWDRAKANTVTTNILQANPNVKGIYFCNDTMALGGMESVAAAGLTGKIILIGTDAIDEALQAVKDGKLDATVAQFPYEEAVLCVENAIKVLEGRPISPTIDAPIKLMLKADIK